MRSAPSAIGCCADAYARNPRSSVGATDREPTLSRGIRRGRSLKTLYSVRDSTTAAPATTAPHATMTFTSRSMCARVRTTLTTR